MFYIKKIKINFSFLCLVRSKNSHQSNAPLLSSSLKVYFKLKGVGKGDISFRASKRAVKDVIGCLRDY